MSNATSVTASASKDEIVALTSLRGVAAMAVVMQHFSATAQMQTRVTIPSLVPHGYMAVDLFFVLSGFIMSYTYQDSFQRRGMRAFGNFLARRLARIVPLNTAIVTLILVAGAISTRLIGNNIFYHNVHLAFDIPANLLMLQGLGIGEGLNGPAWSVSTEFAAYLLFPLFVLVMFDRRPATPVIGLIVCMAGLGWLASLHSRLGLQSDDVVQSVVRCFAEFAMGLGVYRVTTLPRCLAWLARDRVAFGSMAGCAAALLLRVDLAAALLFPFLIGSLAVNSGHPARLLSARIPYFLGVVSFSLYLIHDMFRPLELGLLRAWHPAKLGGPAALLFALLGSLSVVPFAWFAYCAFERPGRVLLRHIFHAHRPVTVIPVD